MKPWKKSAAIDDQLDALKHAPKSSDTVFTYLPSESAKPPAAPATPAPQPAARRKSAKKK